MSEDSSENLTVKKRFKPNSKSEDGKPRFVSYFIFTTNIQHNVQYKTNKKSLTIQIFTVKLEKLLM